MRLDLIVEVVGHGGVGGEGGPVVIALGSHVQMPPDLVQGASGIVAPQEQRVERLGQTTLGEL